MVKSADAILRNALDALEREATEIVQLIGHHRTALAEAEADLRETDTAILELRDLLKARAKPQQKAAPAAVLIWALRT